MADIKKKRKMLDCHGGSLIIKTYREAAGGISSSAADRCAIMEGVLWGRGVVGGGGRWAADGGEIDAAERSQETIRQSARSEEGTTATREELMSAFS